jgi:tetratricopeptide (TPR) repeat protein
MRRWAPVLAICLATVVWAQEKENPPKQEPLKQRPQASGGGKETKEEIPPEEDTALTTDNFSFNPLLAEKSVRVGNFYFKQGKFRAAEGRFRDATKWNEGSAEAWLRLGEVEEKLRDSKAAKEAYTKYLEVASDAKNATDIRKRIAKLK